MKREALDRLQAEYRFGMGEKKRKLEGDWKSILSEFRMKDFRQVLDHIRSYREVNQETLLSAQGRVGSLNLLCRKMAALGNLQNPEFRIDNENPWDEPIAAVLEQAFRAVQRSMGWMPVMDEVNMDAILLGTGITKVGLDSEYVYGEAAWAGKMAGTARTAGTAGTKTSPGAWAEREDRLGVEAYTPAGPTTESGNPWVTEGQPSVIHVSPWDICFNRGAKRPNQIRQIYHRQRRALSDVLRDTRYGTAARRLIWERRIWSMPDGTQSNDCDEETAEVECVECFDVPSRQYCVFVPGLEEAPLRDWTYLTIPIRMPYHFYTPIPDPEWIWGIPYALLILGQAQALNRLRAMLVDQIGRDGKRVFLYDSERIQDEGFIDRINRAKDGEWIAAPGMMSQEGEFFKAAEFGGARPETLRLMGVFERDMNWMSGLTDAARNENTGADQTATEVQFRAQQQGLTIDEFVNRFENYQELVAASVGLVMLATWGQDELVKVTGPTPNIYFWVPVERERVMGNFRLTIVAGSSVKQDKAVVRKQWIELLPRIGEIVQQIQQDQMLSAQTGQAGPVNWVAVLRYTVELFDPTLGDRILNTRNVPELLMRLVGQHGMRPLEVSPELEAMVSASLGAGGGAGGTPALPSGQVVPFEARAGVAAPGRVAQGGMPGEMAGNVSGRALSEAG